MKKWWIVWIGLAFLGALVIYPWHQSLAPYEREISYLKDLIGESPSAQALATLNTLREKHEEGENPDAFMQSLREIKTGTNGETYPPYYRVHELRKARQRGINQRSSSLSWIERGPFNVSGRSRGIAVDPSDPSGNTWFVATVGGGVWKTSDAGESWSFKTPELPTMSVSTIAISESDPDIIYIGTGMGYGRVVDLEGSGVWKSEDHGETWSQLPFDILYDAINRIIIDPDNPNIVVLCSNNSYTSIGPNGGNKKSGIFRTIDGGQTWSQVFDPEVLFGSDRDNRVQQVIATPGNFDVQYASVNEVGVVKSIDGGVTWTVSADDFALSQDIGVGEGTYAGISTRIELAIAPSNPSKIYASIERTSGSAVLRMSEDSGTTWVELSPDGDDMNWHSAYGTSGADGAYTSGWFNNTIVVHPTDENVVYVGGVNLFRIDVNANNLSRTIQPIAWWFTPNEQNVPGIHGDNHLLTVIPGESGFRLVCPNDGGVAYSEDGINWTQKNGMISTQFYGVDKKPGAQTYIGGTQDNGTWRSDKSVGADWTHVLGGDGFEAVWNGRDANLVLGSSQNGNISRSKDGGLSFQPLPDAKVGTAPFITKIANSRTDPDLVYVVTGNGVNRSDNFGESWTETSLSPWIGYRPFSTIKISDAQPQIVWAASRIALDVFGNTGGVHVSTDGGNTFENITANLPLQNEPSGLATDPIDPSTAYLLFSAPGVPKILKTTDLGQTWSDLTAFNPATKVSPNGFPDVAVFSLLVMPYDTNVLWAGTEIGLFISEDGGTSWQIADNGFPPVSVFDLKVRDDEVVVATYGRGIWTAQLPELVDLEAPEVMLAPRLTSLAFHPAGKIRFETDFRSNYDSAHLLLDGFIITRLYDLQEGTSSTLDVPITNERVYEGQVVGYGNGKALYSGVYDTKAFPISVVSSYVNLVNTATDGNDLEGDLFFAIKEAAFSTFAFHSPHPYPKASQLISQLRKSIIVGETYPFLEYKDVLLMEAGNVDDWEDPNFYDFVVVEGSKDGAAWKALAPGYDSRYSNDWLIQFQSNGSGNNDLFESHKIDLTQAFSPGDTIFIRFRLYSDPFVTGWGWVVDNVVVQQEVVTSLDFEQRDTFIYPNPVKDVLNIESSERLQRIAIYDRSGKLHLNKQMNRSGELQLSHLASGVYILRVHSEEGSQSFRFVKE